MHVHTFTFMFVEFIASKFINAKLFTKGFVKINFPVNNIFNITKVISARVGLL